MVKTRCIWLVMILSISVFITIRFYSLHKIFVVCLLILHEAHFSTCSVFSQFLKARETDETDATFTVPKGSVDITEKILDSSQQNLQEDESIQPSTKVNYLFAKVEAELHPKSLPKGSDNSANTKQQHENVERVNSEGTACMLFPFRDYLFSRVFNIMAISVS